MEAKKANKSKDSPSMPAYCMAKEPTVKSRASCLGPRHRRSCVSQFPHSQFPPRGAFLASRHKEGKRKEKEKEQSDQQLTPSDNPALCRTNRIFAFLLMGSSCMESPISFFEAHPKGLVSPFVLHFDYRHTPSESLTSLRTLCIPMLAIIDLVHR